MKPLLNKYIEQSHGTSLYSCGTYRYKFGILPTVTRTMLLPNDMHSSGLFIAGCDCSHRNKFTAHYVKQLLSQNVRVIYITSRFIKEHDANQFCIDIGINPETKEGAHFGEIEDRFNVQPFVDGAKISIVRGGHTLSAYNEYDSRILSALKSISESKLGGRFKTPFVVVIDDDMGKSNGFAEELQIAFKRLGGYDGCAGLVVSTSAPQRYTEVQREFKHYVVFKLCDSIEFEAKYDIFRRNSLKKSPYNQLFAQFCNSIDIRHLEPDNFNYTCSHIAEWAFDIKFSQNR